MFRVVRLGQLNTVIESLVDVRDKLQMVCDKASSWTERLALVSAIRYRARVPQQIYWQSAITLENFATPRHMNIRKRFVCRAW